MRIKSYLKKYDDVVQINHALPVKKQTLLVSSQLKEVRDSLCLGASSWSKVLEAEYAYVIASLNHRHRLWKYDYMTFPRRIGELWESFCKASFYNAKTKLRQFEPPSFYKVKDDLEKKNIDPAVWDIVGDVNLNSDGLFYLGKRLHVIDLKSSFNSKEKGNLLRLRTKAIVYKMWKPTSQLHMLVREEEENNCYLDHLTDRWNVWSGPQAYETIHNLTGIDVKSWITKNVNFKDHLDLDFYRFIEDRSLEKYLNW